LVAASLSNTTVTGLPRSHTFAQSPSVPYGERQLETPDSVGSLK